MCVPSDIGDLETNVIVGVRTSGGIFEVILLYGHLDGLLLVLQNGKIGEKIWK